MSTKTVIYFTADTKPTTAELAEIARQNALSEPAYNVQVRNGGASAKMSSIEPCDYVAGTVPTAYAAKDLLNGDGKIDAARPLAFELFPNTASIANSATLQLYPISATGSGVDAIEQAVPASGIAYTVVSGTSATVHATSGLVTAHATTDGATVIRATYTYATGKTVTSDATITVA